MNKPIMIGRKELSQAFLPERAGLGHRSPQVVCGWCGDQIRSGEGPVSHGICRDCLDDQRVQLQNLREAGILSPLAAD